VLSVWGRRQEQFFDFDLYAYGSGLVVDRATYDQRLVAAAQSAGANVVHGIVDGIRSDGTGWHPIIDGTEVRARVLIDATGRRRRPVSPAIPPHMFRDRLVAFAYCDDTDLSTDALLLEAVPGGWWYASRQRMSVACSSLCPTQIWFHTVMRNAPSTSAEHST
jgi:flavin-dependent dehydrogenase